MNSRSLRMQAISCTSCGHPVDFYSLHSDFLETLDEGSFFTAPTTVTPSLMSSPSFPNPSTQEPTNVTTDPSRPVDVASTNPSKPAEKTSGETPAIVLPAATKTERFLLTAADQESGSRNERLNRVIRSKYEAGLLKPYNYVKGYARLSRWMDSKYISRFTIF